MKFGVATMRRKNDYFKIDENENPEKHHIYRQGRKLYAQKHSTCFKGKQELYIKCINVIKENDCEWFLIKDKYENPATLLVYCAISGRKKLLFINYPPFFLRY